MLIKKGQVIIITDGSYDDYTLVGIFKALKEFESDTILNKMHPYFELDKYDSRSEVFKDYISKEIFFIDNKIKWLKDNGYIGKETDYVELNLDY